MRVVAESRWVSVRIAATVVGRLAVGGHHERIPANGDLMVKGDRVPVHQLLLGPGGPLPLLDDRAAREALTTSRGLEQVRGLLRSYEEAEADMAERQGRAPVSFQFLWDELGITRVWPTLMVSGCPDTGPR